MKLKTLLIAVPFLLPIIVPFSQSFAQRERIQVGDLWETVGGLESPLGLQGLYMVWPGGGEQGASLYEGGFRTNSTGALLRFMFKDYAYEVKDTLGNVIETRTIPFYHPGYALKTKTQPYYPETVKWMRTYRGPTTVITEDGVEHKNLVEAQSMNVIAYNKLIADEMVEYTEFFNDGFYVKSKFYAWANPYHDDYILRVVEIVNNGNLDNDVFTQEMTPRNLTNLYIDYYVNNLSPNNKGEAYYSYAATGRWDNWHDYYGDKAGDTLRYMFAFDGDDPNIPGDDRGDPFPIQFIEDYTYNPNDLYDSGEFVSAMFAGYGVVYVDQSTTVRKDNPAQPFSYNFGDYTRAPGWREELRWLEIYHSGEKFYKHPDYSQQVPYGQEACWMALGPFNLPAFGKLRIAFVHAVNGPSIRQCKETGKKYLAGEISKAEKELFLDSGRDSLALTIGRAKWNWDKYLAANKMMPNAPLPPTELVIRSMPNAISLDWKASASPDVAHYKIYRKAGNNLGDFDLVAELPTTATSYVDSLLDLGVAYFYYITAANDGTGNVDPTCWGKPLESSKFFNRSYHPAKAYRKASGDLSQVRVVPNPYNMIQAQSWPGEPDRLTFVNLTPRCIVRVFTVNGDLVKTLKKMDDSAYIHWTPMLTDDNLFIAPDIYIYHVEDLDTGKTTYGKFIVVR